VDVRSGALVLLATVAEGSDEEGCEHDDHANRPLAMYLHSEDDDEIGGAAARKYFRTYKPHKHTVKKLAKMAGERWMEVLQPDNPWTAKPDDEDNSRKLWEITSLLAIGLALAECPPPLSVYRQLVPIAVTRDWSVLVLDSAINGGNAGVDVPADLLRIIAEYELLALPYLPLDARFKGATSANIAAALSAVRASCIAEAKSRAKLKYVDSEYPSEHDGDIIEDEPTWLLHVDEHGAWQGESYDSDDATDFHVEWNDTRGESR